MMSRIVSSLMALIVCSIMFSGAAVAHAPTSFGENHTLATAAHIEEPSKSWAIYSELEAGGEARYYSFDMEAGQRIYVSLIVATGSKDTGFIPSLALMGPGIALNESTPALVERLGGDNGTMVKNGSFSSQAYFEPFSPSTFYEVASVDIEAPSTGDYYLAIYEEANAGNFGLAIGYIETYSISEYISIPFSLIGVYGWEGQNILMIFAPMIAMLAVGIALMYNRTFRRDIPFSAYQWMAFVGGLMIMGTGAIVLFQLLYVLTLASAGGDIIVTLIFAALPILLGLGVVRVSLSELRPEKKRSRAIKLVLMGVVSIFVWGGYLIGPMLAIASGIAPFVMKKGSAEAGKVEPQEKKAG